MRMGMMFMLAFIVCTDAARPARDLEIQNLETEFVEFDSDAAAVVKIGFDSRKLHADVTRITEFAAFASLDAMRAASAGRAVLVSTWTCANQLMDCLGDAYDDLGSFGPGIAAAVKGDFNEGRYLFIDAKSRLHMRPGSSLMEEGEQEQNDELEEQNGLTGPKKKRNMKGGRKNANHRKREESKETDDSLKSKTFKMAVIKVPKFFHKAEQETSRIAIQAAQMKRSLAAASSVLDGISEAFSDKKLPVLGRWKSLKVILERSLNMVNRSASIHQNVESMVMDGYEICEAITNHLAVLTGGARHTVAKDSATAQNAGISGTHASAAEDVHATRDLCFSHFKLNDASFGTDGAIVEISSKSSEASDWTQPVHSSGFDEQIDMQVHADHQHFSLEILDGDGKPALVSHFPLSDVSSDVTVEVKNATPDFSHAGSLTFRLFNGKCSAGGSNTSLLETSDIERRQNAHDLSSSSAAQTMSHALSTVDADGDGIASVHEYKNFRHESNLPLQQKNKVVTTAAVAGLMQLRDLLEGWQGQAQHMRKIRSQRSNLRSNADGPEDEDDEENTQQNKLSNFTKLFEQHPWKTVTRSMKSAGHSMYAVVDLAEALREAGQDAALAVAEVVKASNLVLDDSAEESLKATTEAVKNEANKLAKKPQLNGDLDEVITKKIVDPCGCEDADEVGQVCPPKDVPSFKPMDWDRCKADGAVEEEEEKKQCETLKTAERLDPCSAYHKCLREKKSASQCIDARGEDACHEETQTLQSFIQGEKKACLDCTECDTVCQKAAEQVLPLVGEGFATNEECLKECRKECAFLPEQDHNNLLCPGTMRMQLGLPLPEDSADFGPAVVTTDGKQELHCAKDGKCVGEEPKNCKEHPCLKLCKSDTWIDAFDDQACSNAHYGEEINISLQRCGNARCLATCAASLAQAQAGCTPTAARLKQVPQASAEAEQQTETTTTTTITTTTVETVETGETVDDEADKAEEEEDQVEEEREEDEEGPARAEESNGVKDEVLAEEINGVDDEAERPNTTEQQKTSDHEDDEADEAEEDQSTAD